MKNKLYLFLFLISLLFFTGCIKDSSKDPSPSEKDNANEWIVDKMREVYLWNDEIPENNKGLNLSSESPDFFESLLSMKDGKTRNGKHYFYSTINEKKKESKAYMGDGFSFGFEFQYYLISEKPKTFGLQVLYILPNSPAEDIGLKRGDWILRINDKPVTGDTDELIELIYPNIPSTLTFDVSQSVEGENIRSVQVTAREVYDDPVFVHKTITYGGKKIGYLMYNHFTAGIEDNGQEFNNSLRSAFTQFKSEKPEEFILDLRYNGGGLVSCAQLLATMLAPVSVFATKDEPFCIMIDNKKQASPLPFDYSEKEKNINLNKLYIITSSRTASASEAVINGLRPYMEVIIVGEQTEGKNVGSRTYTDSAFEWELHPIVTKISNKNGLSDDYPEGFSPRPDYECSESGGRELKELGNPEEYILGLLLDNIVYGNSFPSKSTLKSSGDLLEPLYNSLDRKKVNSVILD